MSDQGSPIRILVVDDHPVVRAGIEALMTGHADMIVIAQAANGREAIQQFRTHRPDETVKGQVRNILSKLGAKDRTHAAMIGLKRGIIGL